MPHKDRAAKLWCEYASDLTRVRWQYLKIPQQVGELGGYRAFFADSKTKDFKVGVLLIGGTFLDRLKELKASTTTGGKRLPPN